MDDISLIKRLALIRHTYQIGVRQSESPAPYGAMSLLTFHDSLEWFLITACDYFAIDIPGPEKLLDYFDRLGEKNPAVVGRTTLKKCMGARREFKHRLIIPDVSSLQEIRFATGIFLSENSFYLFGVDLDRINLVDGIQEQEIRAQIKESIRLMEEENYDECTRHLRRAYRKITELYGLNLIPGWYHTCGINPHALLCFERLAFIGGPYPKQQEIAFKEGCAFCCDFLIEAVVKIEQGMSRGDLSVFQSLLQELNTRQASFRLSQA